MKGSYVLLVKIPEAQTISVGGLGAVKLPGRYYAYVGSALGGFKPRLGRHLREDKNPKWHIDYLLQIAPVYGIILVESGEKVECTIAQALNRNFGGVPGFGSTDCDCMSHLFCADRDMEQAVLKTLRFIGMNPVLLDNLGRVREYY